MAKKSKKAEYEVPTVKEVDLSVLEQEQEQEQEQTANEEQEQTQEQGQEQEQDKQLELPNIPTRKPREVLYPKAAQKMRDLLQSTGLSNTEFAGFLQLSSANLSGYLSGKVRPGYPALGYLEAVGGPTARDWLSEQEETELHSVFAQVELSIEQSLEKTKEKLERLQNMAKKSA